MYKFLLKQLKNDLYDLDHIDLASYITMARKIVEDHEKSLISSDSSPNRNIQK